MNITITLFIIFYILSLLPLNIFTRQPMYYSMVTTSSAIQLMPLGISDSTTITIIGITLQTVLMVVGIVASYYCYDTLALILLLLIAIPIILFMLFFGFIFSVSGGFSGKH